MTDFGVAQQTEDPPDTTGAPHATGSSLKISSPNNGTGSKPAKRAELYVIRSPRFPISRNATDFRRKYFPTATSAEWNDWRWQLRNRIRSLDELSRIFELSDSERQAVEQHQGSLPVGITPYYASLLNRTDPTDPLRRTHIPVLGEYLKTQGEEDDPLHEDGDTTTPGLVHRYPDRVLFLATGFCSTYCRYCTRSRMVGEAGGEYSVQRTPVGTVAGLYRGAPGNPGRADFGRRSLDPCRQQARLAPWPPAGDQACRVRPHRHQGSLRAAPAHYPRPRAGAAQASPDLDEHPLHAPQRVDARGCRSLQPSGRLPGCRWAARPCC